MNRLLLFLYLLGYRFDATDIRYAWGNSRAAFDGYAPGSIVALWAEAIRRLL